MRIFRSQPALVPALLLVPGLAWLGYAPLLAACAAAVGTATSPAVVTLVAQDLRASGQGCVQSVELHGDQSKKGVDSTRDKVHAE